MSWIFIIFGPVIENITNIKQKNKQHVNPYKNQKVLVRAPDAGVYFGTLEEQDGEQKQLSNVRNIWPWEGATCLSQIANDGIGGGRVSQVVGSMLLNRCCQVIPLTDKAIANLEEQPEWCGEKIDRFTSVGRGFGIGHGFSNGFSLDNEIGIGNGGGYGEGNGYWVR